MSFFILSESILEETDAPPSASHDVPWHQEVAQEDNTRKDDSGQGKLEDSSDSTTTPQMLEHSQLVTLQQRVSNLELENKLLKREVASLNDELGVMMGRVRDAGESVAQYEREISALRDHTSQSDHMIRQMRSQEEDLQAALEARDSQIEVRFASFLYPLSSSSLTPALLNLVQLSSADFEKASLRG